MAGEQALHMGDVVYFSLSSEGEERKIWTSAIEQVPNFQLVEEEKVTEPVLALFRLESQEPAGRILKPGASVKLFHLLTGLYVYADGGPAVLEAKFISSPATELSFSVATPRGDLGDYVLDGDLVAISTGNSPVYSLGKDLWFMVGRSAVFKLHRYQAYNVPESAVLCGFPVKFNANGYFLSVSPNYDRSEEFKLKKRERKADFLMNSELNYPEYQGKLKADLNTDAVDGNNYWVIERENRLKGGVVQPGHAVFVRHVASGKYLQADLSLGEREKALFWGLGAQEEAKSLFLAGEKAWIGYENRLISLRPCSSLKSLRSQLFQSCPQFVPLRESLSPQPLSGLQSPLTFTLELPAPKLQTTLLAYSLYRFVLPKLRLSLQHFPALPDPAAALKQLSPSLGLRSLNLSTIEMDYAAAVAADFQIVTELLRCWMLAKLIKKKKKQFAGLMKELEFLETLHCRLQNLFFFQRVVEGLFRRQDLLIKMANSALAPFCDVFQWAIKSHPPKDSDRIFWSEVFLSSPLPMNTYPEFISLNFFCHHLLDNLKTPILFKDLHGLKRDDLFIIRFEKEGNNFVANSFGNVHSVAELIENLSGFVATTVELAAEMCVLTKFKQEIVQGMGLDVQSAMELFEVFAPSIRVQLSLLYFIGKVHISSLSPYTPASKLASSCLLPSSAFNCADSLQRTQDFYYFTALNSPLFPLIPRLAAFWLQKKHETTEDPTTWYYNSANYIRFASKLIDFRCVSDIFVGSAVLGAIAVAEFVLGEAVPALADRFPAMTASKFRTETEKQRVVDFTLELIQVYHSWKLVRVLGELKPQLFPPVQKGKIEEIVQLFDLKSVWKRHYEANVSEMERLFSEKGVLSRSYEALMESPDVNILSFLDLLGRLGFRGHLSLAELSEIRSKEANFPAFVSTYLSNVYEEVPFQPYRFYLRSIRDSVLSPIQLSREQNDQVTGLRSYLEAMETLADFMGFLKGKNLQSFQMFLEKESFEEMLERMWMYCDAVSEDEEQQSVQLKSLTLELTSFYCESSPSHQEAVKQLLQRHDLLPDFPQYLSLLRQLQLLQPEVAGHIARKLISRMKPMKHYILALQKLVEDPYCLSASLTGVIEQCFLRFEGESLSGPLWEVLIVFIQAVPAAHRVRLFAPVLAKWYEADTTQIRREGAALLTYTNDTVLDIFHQGLQATVSHVSQLNQRPADVLAGRLKSFSQDAKSVRDRNFDQLENDLNYVLELLWQRNGGVLELVGGWMPRITLQNLLSQLAQLYLLLDPADTPHADLERLYHVIHKYVWNTDDPQSDEDQARFKEVMAKGLPEPRQDNQSDAGIRIEDMLPLTRVID